MEDIFEPRLSDLLKAISDIRELQRQQFERLDKLISNSAEKESYTVEEAAERLRKAKWTVRQWCNLGYAQATKIRSRGRTGEWRISHDELVRLQNEGPLHSSS